MAEDRVALTVLEREERGSAAVRRLRKRGFVPGVVYGGGVEPVAISIAERDLRQALTSHHGLNAILDVQVDGQTKPVILKEYQRDPLTGRVAHVDLVVVRLDRAIQTTVSVELVGESPGVKEGGALQQVARELTVEALPLEVPDRIEADISGLGIGDSLRLSEIAALPGVRFVDDPDETIVATVTMPTRVEEPEEALEEAEEGEGAVAEEGVEGAPEADGEAVGEPDTAQG